MTCKLSLESLPASVAVTLSIINIIIALLALCGNSLVFIVVYRNKNLRTRSNCCLVSLASTDFFVGLALEPLFIMQLLSSEIALSCDVNAARRFFTAMLTGASMSTIALISYDRYVHVSKTVNYNEHMKKATTGIFIFLSWFLPLACTFFKYIGKDELVYSGSIFVYSVIMVIIIVVSYLKIMRSIKLKRASLQCTSGDNLNKQQERRQGERMLRTHERAAKAIAIIIVCFAIFIAPISVFHGLSAFMKVSSNAVLSKKSTMIFYAIAMTISKANSAINPFIYYSKMPDFKDTARKVFNQLSVGSSNDIVLMRSGNRDKTIKNLDIK